MKLGPLPDAMDPADTLDPADAMDPDIHGVRTHWIWGFMAFWLARRTRIVRLMVSA